MNRGNRTGYVANFMRDGCNRNAGSGKELVQTGHLVSPEFLRTIEHHSGQARSRIGAVSGETDVGEKGLSVVALPASLHHTAEISLRRFGPGHIRQRRKVSMDGLSGQSALGQ